MSMPSIAFLTRLRLGLSVFLLGGMMSLGACTCGTPPGDDAGTDPEPTVAPTDGGDPCEAGTADCVCRDDDTCDTDLACNAGTCEACTWGSDGCPCASDGSCTGDLICDTALSECRGASSCENLGCAQHQLCSQEPGGDAECLAECEEGWRWNAVTSACDPIESCDVDAPGYLDCGANRICDDTGATPECGDCEAGYVDLDEDGEGDCVENSCANLCGEGRQCEEADGGLPVCGDCETGYVYDETNDSCVDRATCAEIPACDPNTEVCQEATATEDAQCVTVTQCPLGQGDDGTGTCTRCNECFEFDGANVMPKTGVAGIGNNGAFYREVCVCELEDGYFQSHNDGIVKACDADNDGWVNADFASMRASGGVFLDESKCTVRTIDKITLVSDDGAQGGVNAAKTVSVADVATRYNLQTQAELGESATIKIGSDMVAYVELLEPEITDSVGEFDNRYRDDELPATRLRTYGGFTMPTLTTPDAGVPDADGGVADGGTDAGTGSVDAGTATPGTELQIHRFHAGEVNPLTKACNHDDDDLNFDGIADVLQSHDTTSFDATADTTVSVEPTDFVATEFYYRLAYFTELNVGFFRADAECTQTSCRGGYIIAERSRVMGPAQLGGLLFEYPDTVDGYWKTCMRGRDPNYAGDNDADLSINADFAGWHDFCDNATGDCLSSNGRIPYDGRSFADFFDDGKDREGVRHGLPADDNNGEVLWPGMNHHSQFKCVSFSDSLYTNQAEREAPTGTYHGQDCRLEPHYDEGAMEGINPSVPSMVCTLDANLAANAAEEYNYFVALAQQDYTASPAGYKGGCIDEGREWGVRGGDSQLCIVQNENQAEENFGQLFCGCGTNRTGALCEIGCPDQNLFSNRQAVDGELVGYWMCARPSATEGVTLSGGGYKLRGEIPAVAMPTEVMRDDQVDADGGHIGYTLRPYLIQGADPIVDDVADAGVVDAGP